MKKIEAIVIPGVLERRNPKAAALPVPPRGTEERSRVSAGIQKRCLVGSDAGLNLHVRRARV